MTALPTEAGSFSSRGGLTRAQPGPGGDVAGPVEVGVQLAVDGADDGVLPGSSASGPADVAVDRGVGGCTRTTRRPALSALATRMLVNWPQPASRIDRFSPALAATLRPGCSTVPLAEAVMAATRSSSSAMVSQVSTSPVGGLVVEVAPLVADRAPLLGERPPEPPAVAGAGPGAFLAALQVGDPLLGGIRGTAGWRRPPRRWWSGTAPPPGRPRPTGPSSTAARSRPR